MSQTLLPPIPSFFFWPTSSAMIVIMGCESRVDRTEECLGNRGGRGKRPAALQSPNSLGDDGTRLQTYCGSLRKNENSRRQTLLSPIPPSSLVHYLHRHSQKILLLIPYNTTEVTHHRHRGRSCFRPHLHCAPACCMKPLAQPGP